MKKIYTYTRGQLCNKLWSILPILAYCLHEHTELYVINAYKAYLRLFPNLTTNPNIRFILSSNYREYPLRKIIAHISQKLHIEKIIDDKRIPKFINSWASRYQVTYIKEMKETIKYLFAPSKHIENIIDKCMNRQRDDIIIGIHLRRGDYKNYRDGLFYYSIEHYFKLMEEIFNLLPPLKNIKYLLCSNESFDENDSKYLRLIENKKIADYIQNNIIRINNKEITSDLYALSKCDYIFGPPSTFSQWASFYGNVPLLFIKNDKQIINSLSEFSPIILMDRFANGNVLEMS